MTGDPNGEEKTESLTKTERTTASQRGIIGDPLSGTGNGRKMALITPGKTAFHILCGTAVDPEHVPGGTRGWQAAHPLGFITTVVLEVAGTQIMER